MPIWSQRPSLKSDVLAPDDPRRGQPVRNRLLKALPPADLDLVARALVPVDLPVGSTLELPGKPYQYAHFIEDGFASVVIQVGKSASEIGLIGREGMLGTPAVLGSQVADYTAVVRHPGYAFRAAVSDLSEILRQSEALRSAVLRFVQAGFVQVAHLSYAAHRLTVTQRLARWLLMAHDRIDGFHMRISHEVLATALSVRRSGVTVALHELEGEGCVRAKRNSLLITDREALKRTAGPAYGPAERAYEKLFAASDRSSANPG